MLIFCVARWRSACGMIEWLCTQERLSPEVAIIFGAGARYRRATVGSSHDDAHPYNSTLHTGAVRPHTGFVGGLFFISPRTGHGNSKVFEMLPAFSCISCACAFRAGDDTFSFSVGPLGSLRGVKSEDWLSWLALLEYNSASSPW
jgi:hypothetical protein